MTWNAEEAWREVIAPGWPERGSKSLLCWVCYLEGKKGSEGQGKRRGQKIKACRGER